MTLRGPTVLTFGILLVGCDVIVDGERGNAFRSGSDAPCVDDDNDDDNDDDDDCYDDWGDSGYYDDDDDHDGRGHDNDDDGP